VTISMIKVGSVGFWRRELHLKPEVRDANPISEIMSIIYN